ncbi:MAG TPA: carboxypeptidase regulatory-like domain-containing protein [Gaiellaceae bacterium]|nr:carboxypeptidase regulatory-like domain-containing protein [Gaiellaceae bacterium]
MSAPRRKAIAGALFAALFLTAIALAGNNLSGTSTRSVAVRHVSGPASQFASSTGSSGKGTPAEPQKGANPQGITVGRSYKNAISPSVRSLGRAHGTGQLQSRPELPPLFTGKPLRQVDDPVVQDKLPDPNMPNPIFNFEGIDYPGVVCFCAPPDTNGDVGLTQYVQEVNEGFQVFDKSTGLAEGPPVATESLWTGFGGRCENFGHGDGVVVYDPLANRWLISQFAGNFPVEPITDQCVAVSTTSDAMGTYAVYGFHMTDNFYDYPKFGVWPDAYYASANIFDSGGNFFLGPAAYAFDRDAMLAGAPATFIEAPMGSPSDDSYMPADLDGTVPPPAGAPNPYVSIGVLSTWPVHRFHVDFNNPLNSTFDFAGALTPAPFTPFGGGIPQLGGDPLDSLGDRGMFRNAYRNYGDHEALVGNITVSSGGVTGVRWFEVNNVTSGTPAFTQQGTFQPDSTYRWMGSAAMDNDGDLALGFSASSSSIFPQIRYAGRLSGDPPGDLTQGEAHLFDGTGSQTDTVSRWGDYSDMTVDPVDDCTFWYTQEYYDTTSSFNWRTRIGNFKFPTCTAAPSGTIVGTVTDSVTSQPIAGAHINVTPLGAGTTTGPDGHYSLTLPVNTYDVTASAFGYQTQTANGVVVTDGGTTTQNFALVAAPSHTVSGHVHDVDGNPLANATVTIVGTPIPPATTDATGAYSIPSVPEGEYDVRAAAGRCNTPQTQHLVVNGDETLDFSLPQRHDNFGYFCQLVTPNYVEGDTQLPLSGDDNVISVNLPFPFTFYGQNYNTAFVTTNGFLNFLSPNATFFNSAIPSTFAPNGAIYPFWDDLFMDASSTAWTKVTGSAPNRQFVIEWRNVTFFSNRTPRIDFEVILTENGRILTQYRNIAQDSMEQGNSATIGIENATGTDAFQYSFNEATIESPDFAVLYRLPPSGFVEGTVTDDNDHAAVGGAVVKAKQNGNVVRQTTTNASGFYRMQLAVGNYTIEASKANYETGSADVAITVDQTTTQDFSLRTARGDVDPTSLEFTLQRNETQTKTLTLSNTGGLPMTWDVKESGGGAALPSRSQGSKLMRVELSKDERADPGWAGDHAQGHAPRVNAGPPLAPTWSTIASYPVDIMDNSNAIIEGKEYSVGGFNFSLGVTNRGHVYDPGTNSWSPIADMPMAREKPGVASANGLLYVTGGWNSSGIPIAQTDVYDPSTDTWSTVAPNPSPTAAPGVAVADGKIYLVGGCADSFCTPSSTVVRYDPASDSWDTVAPYPTTDSWEACGGISGRVYCSGGVSGGTTFSSGNVFDPGSNSWSPIADMPIDLWGSVSGAANGLLVVSSGVTNGFNTVTNQGFSYDPSADSWTALPNAQFARYRAGGSCGFYKVGGSSAGFSPSPDSERLSELEECAEFTDVPWLSESPTSGTIDPGGHTTVQVTVDTHGLIPGNVYQAKLTFRTNSGRRPNLTVPVRLVVPALGLNSGGGAYMSPGGEPWLADRVYTAANQAGYVQSPKKTASTRSAIGGTDEDPLYQDARISPMVYRITGLPDAVYKLELKFAEIQNKSPGQRQFDVIVNGNPYLIAFDISALVGRDFALDRTSLVHPVNGEITVQLAKRQAQGEPLLSAIRVGQNH